MPDRIHIHGLALDTVIGVFEWERRVRQSLRVDVELECDLREAGATDRLGDTVDYKSLSQRIRQRLESSRYRLIETLACDAAAICLDDGRVTAARVTVNKLGALRGADNVAVTVERRRGEPDGRAPHTAFVGIGSNVVPVANVRGALQRIHDEFGAIRVSPVYRTEPFGGVDGPAYLNLVVELRCDMEPRTLQNWLHELEVEHGRPRDHDPGAPRTLDADLLLYDDVVSDESPQLPHPQVRETPFVLVPLADIAPDVVYPGSNDTIADLRAGLPGDVPGVTPFEDDVVF